MIKQIQKRFATLLVLIIFLLVTGVAVLYFKNFPPMNKTTMQSQTGDAKKATVSPLIEKKATNTNTASWRVYKNEKYGFEFKYPAELAVDLKNIGFMSGSDYYGYRDLNVLITNPNIEPSVTDYQMPMYKSYDGYNFALFSGEAARKHVKNLEDLRMSHKKPETISITINNSSYKIYTIKLEPPNPPNYSFTHFPGKNYEVLVGSGYNKEVLYQILSTFKFIE